MRRSDALAAMAVLVFLAIEGCSGGKEPAQDPAEALPAATAPAQLPTVDAGTDAAAPAAPSVAPFALHIDAFEDGGLIPDRSTCMGENESPGVSWSGVPPEARSLALIVYDADAGEDLGAGNDLGFLHWMVYDLSPTAAGLPPGATGKEALLAGGIEAGNDFAAAAGGTFPGGATIRGTGYDGPCPPARHTYVFRLLALREPLALPQGTPYQSVMSALEGRVLVASEWTGIYPP